LETEVLDSEENLKGLAALNKKWVDRPVANGAHKPVILDMASRQRGVRLTLAVDCLIV
jgi:hypothetical protein